MASTISILSYQFSFAQVPQSKIVNSTFTSITDQQFEDGESTDQIIGTVINNSTAKIADIPVFVGFYDNNNQFITMEIEYADSSLLVPGANSTLSISWSGLEDENIDYYILYPGGKP